MRLVDENVGVNVGRVDPVPGKIPRQPAAGLNHLRLNRRDMQSLGTLFHRLQSITFGRYRDADVQVVVAVLQEAPVLFVLPRLLGVGNGEIVVLIDEPIAQAAVLDEPVEGAGHAGTLLVGYVELLVGDQELRPGRLAGPYVGIRVAALAGELEPVLVREVPHAFERRPAVDRNVVLAEQGHQLLVLVEVAADVFHRYRHVLANIDARR